MVTTSELLEQDLKNKCAEIFDAESQRKLNNFFEYLHSRRSVCPDHPSASAYLAHPIRVALYVLAMQKNPTFESVAIGLLHNAFEVFAPEDNELHELGCSNAVVSTIRCLTVFRPKEADPSYLKQYYEEIRQRGQTAMLVRSVDKLDNLLGLEIFEDIELRNKYAHLADQFITPIAFDLNHDFGRYFQEVSQYMQNAKFNSRLCKEYQDFIRRDA